MSSFPQKRWFNVGEFHRMAESGVLTEEDRVELIDGEVVRMTPIGARHVACVNRLNLLFGGLAQSQFIVSIQNPLRLDQYNEVYPDVALLKPPSGISASQLPVAADALLIIEVAETSLDYDRTVKLPRYARAGIPETWITDLGGEHIEAYRDPHNNIYRVSRVYHRGEKITPHLLPGLQISVDDILG